MKIRVRLDRQTKLITIGHVVTSSCDLAALKKAVSEEFGIVEFQLSLNKQTPLEGDTISLADHGIVSGDLVHILLDCSHCIPVAETSKKVKIQETSVKDCTSTVEKPAMSHSGQSSTSSTKSGSHSASANSEDAAPPMDVENDPDAIKDEAANVLLREPLRVCESSQRNGLPQHLLKAYDKAEVHNENEAFGVICHVLMTEVGFIAKPSDPSASISEVEKYAFPVGWKIPGAYRFCYCYPQMNQVEFTMVLVPLGNVIMVHGSAEKGGNTHLSQLQLKPSDYVKSILLGVADAYKLDRIPKLSNLFKDKIAYPLLHNASDDTVPIVPRLDCLVLELKLSVLKHLDVKSLLTVSQTCKELNTASQEPVLWRRLYLKEYGRRQNHDISQDWQNLYKNKYEMRKQMQRRQPYHHPNPMWPDPGSFFNQPNPPFPMAPTPPGFIIGGDYDRDPHFGGVIDPLGRGRFPGGVGPQPPGPMMPRPRFDPFGPLPDQQFRPGRGGGMWDDDLGPRRRNPFGGGGNFGGGLGGGFI